MSYQRYLAEKVKNAQDWGVSWITFGNFRLKLAPVPPHEELYDTAGPAIIKNRGKVDVVWYVTKDTGTRFREYNRGFYFNYNQIMAMIVETHLKDREPIAQS